MNNDGIEEIKALDGEDRYDFFLASVVEERELWILINDQKEFLKIYSDEMDLEFLPVWPSMALAEDYNQGSTEKLSTKSITLPIFLTKWSKGLERDGLSVGVFPGPGENVWMMSPEELSADIQYELSSAF